MSDKFKTFLKRLFSTIISLAVVAAACILYDGICLQVLVPLLCNLAAVEWFFMLRKSDAGEYRWLVMLAGLIYPWCFYFSTSFAFPIEHAPSPCCLVGLIIFVLLAFLCEVVRMNCMGRSPETALRNLGICLVAFIYPGWLFAFAMFFLSPSTALMLLLFIAVTKMSDIWTYLCGVLVGRRFISRPFSPAVSPEKSWEGIIGSLLLTTFSGTVLLRLVEPECSILLAASISALLFLISVVGNLACSLIKRCLGVKDSSHLLPGIGGIIDLIASPSFTVAALVVAFPPF